MRFEGIDLKTIVGNLFTLKEPFWIASSHHTSANGLKSWKEYSPAALTLKSSQASPVAEPQKRHSYRERLHPVLSQYGRSQYCDGPKNEEFIEYAATKELLASALTELNNTLVGVSVVASPDEDYSTFSDSCKAAGFFELNLKYSFRPQVAEAPASLLPSLPQRFDALLTEVKKFCTALAGRAVLVKIPRELAWLSGTQELATLLDVLRQHGKAGVILANSLKKDLAPFVSQGREIALTGGVLCGETLYDETIRLVKDWATPCADRKIPIIASGGLITGAQILHALQAGAEAVQLCTTFDYNKHSYYRSLRAGLTARIYFQGLDSFREFKERLPRLGTAALHQVPVGYFRQFWNAEAQGHLKADVRRSERMDMLAMSGFTLYDRWEDEIKKRFQKNLGLRLLLPHSESPVFLALQRAWGLEDGPAMDARKFRVNQASQRYESLWKTMGPPSKAPQGAGVSETADSTGFFAVRRHNKCPFFACYLFDDNAYVTPYSFGRASEDTPVYVFFRDSEEYQRLSTEFDGLWRLAEQIDQSAPLSVPTAEVVAFTDGPPQP